MEEFTPDTVVSGWRETHTKDQDLNPQKEQESGSGFLEQQMPSARGELLLLTSPPVQCELKGTIPRSVPGPRELPAESLGCSLEAGEVQGTLDREGLSPLRWGGEGLRPHGRWLRQQSDQQGLTHHQSYLHGYNSVKAAGTRQTAPRMPLSGEGSLPC